MDNNEEYKSSISPSNELYAAIIEAEQKALDNLSRHKFMMFGYHAAVNVTLRHLEGKRRGSPFGPLVRQARAMLTDNQYILFPENNNARK